MAKWVKAIGRQTSRYEMNQVMGIRGAAQGISSVVIVG